MTGSRRVFRDGAQTKNRYAHRLHVTVIRWLYICHLYVCNPDECHSLRVPARQLDGREWGPAPRTGTSRRCVYSQRYISVIP